MTSYITWAIYYIILNLPFLGFIVLSSRLVQFREGSNRSTSLRSLWLLRTVLFGCSGSLSSPLSSPLSLGVSISCSCDRYPLGSPQCTIGVQLPLSLFPRTPYLASILGFLGPMEVHLSLHSKSILLLCTECLFFRSQWGSWYFRLSHFSRNWNFRPESSVH